MRRARKKGEREGGKEGRDGGKKIWRKEVRGKKDYKTKHK